MDSGKVLPAPVLEVGPHEQIQSSSRLSPQPSRSSFAQLDYCTNDACAQRAAAWESDLYYSGLATNL